MALRLDDAPPVERQALMERQLASRELAAERHPAGVVAAADEGAALLVNEEDHVRLQVIGAGLDLDGCLARAVATDQALEAVVPWAFHPRYGYLTACHTNTGTGMRASVMLHLPALHETGELKAVLRALAKLNLTVRGAHGEGSEARGHRYQVSNLRALGVDEQTIAATVAEAAQQVVAAERLARQALAEKQRTLLEDKVWRAWGLLTHARTLTSEEFDEHLSWVRLGSALRVLNPDHVPSWRALDRIALHAQPAHIQLRFPDAADSAVRDRRRAELVRHALQQVEP